MISELYCCCYPRNCRQREPFFLSEDVRSNTSLLSVQSIQVLTFFYRGIILAFPHREKSRNGLLFVLASAREHK